MHAGVHVRVSMCTCVCVSVCLKGYGCLFSFSLCFLLVIFVNITCLAQHVAAPLWSKCPCAARKSTWGSQVSGRILNTIHMGLLCILLQKQPAPLPASPLTFPALCGCIRTLSVQLLCCFTHSGDLLLPTGLLLDSPDGVAIAMASGSTGVGKVG